MASKTLKTVEKTFKLEAKSAKEVYIAGSFNNWNTLSHKLKKDKKGIWSIKISLPKGKHEYKFIVDGEWLTDPNCKKEVKNPFGSFNSLIEV